MRHVWSPRTKALVVGVAVVFVLAAVPAVYAISDGTGVLYMYDSNETTLLPQCTSCGTLGYILTATGTTVYVQVKEITESTAMFPCPSPSTSECTNLQLQYSGYTEMLSNVPLTSTTTCPTGYSSCYNSAEAPWTVGDFSGAAGVTIGACTTGIVVYGQGPGGNMFYSTMVSGSSSEQGHFYGSGTPTTGCPSVPEFPISFGGLLAVLAVAMPALLLLRRKSLGRF